MENKTMEENVEVTKNQEKPSKKKLFLGIGVLAVVIAICAIFGAKMENAIRKLISSPESYYQWLEQGVAEETASNAAKFYEIYLEHMERAFDTGYKGELEVSLTEAGQNVVSLLTGIKQEQLSWLESVSVITAGTVKDTKAQSVIALELGQDTIISLDAIVDYAKGMFVYLAIPQLSNQYMGLETGLTKEEVGLEQIRQLFAILQEQLPDSETVEHMINRYLSVILKELNKVEKSSDILQVEHIAQKCTQLQVTVDKEIAEQVKKTILEQLRADEQLKTYVISIVDAIKSANISGFEVEKTGKQVYEDFITSLTKAEQESLETEYEKIVMTVFVDNDGTIMARKVEIFNAETITEFAVLTAREGKELVINAYVIPTKDGDRYELVGTGIIDGSNIVGEFAVQYNGTEIVQVTVENLDIISSAKGYIDGHFTMQMPAVIENMIDSAYFANTLSELQIGLEIQTGIDYSDVTVSLFNNEEKWFSIATITDICEAEEVVLPTNMIAMETKDDMEVYWNSIQWDSFIAHLKQTSVNSEVISVLESLSKMTFTEVYFFAQIILSGIF